MNRNETWGERIDRYIAEGRTVSGGKGDSTLKASEDLSLQNQTAQIGFNKQLMDIFTKQYGDQKGVLDFIKGKMMPQVENPQGYSPDALAAMRTSASDTNAQAAENARQSINARSIARGGRDLPSGVDAQIAASIDSGAAGQEASSQNAITQSNEDLKQKNYWNALNVLGGNAAMMAPQSYAGAAEGASGAASSAGNATTSAGQAYDATRHSGFFSILGDSFAKGLGGGIGAFLGGGAGVKPFSG